MAHHVPPRMQPPDSIAVALPTPTSTSYAKKQPRYFLQNTTNRNAAAYSDFTMVRVAMRQKRLLRSSTKYIILPGAGGRSPFLSPPTYTPLDEDSCLRLRLSRNFLAGLHIHFLSLISLPSRKTSPPSLFHLKLTSQDVVRLETLLRGCPPPWSDSAGALARDHHPCPGCDWNGR